jgi:UDPglucose 6-dehydrogenase
MGIVGNAYANAFKSKNMKVTGIEKSIDLIDKYKSDFEMYHIDDDLSQIKDVDFIMISVNTPLNKETNELDMSYLFSTIDNVESIVKNNPNVLIILRSTVIPFTTKKYKEILETKLKHKVQVLFIPEFLRAKTAFDDALNPWKVIIGINDEDINLKPLIELYSNFIEENRVAIMSIEEAELLKIFHNSFNACKISYFNQCFLLCEKINNIHNSNIDMQKISNNLVKTCEGLINTKYGTKVNQPYGGFCLIKDGQELAKLEEQYNLESNLFKSVVDTNNIMINIDKKENKIEIFGPNQISSEEMKK